MTTVSPACSPACPHPRVLKHAVTLADQNGVSTRDSSGHHPLRVVQRASPCRSASHLVVGHCSADCSCGTAPIRATRKLMAASARSRSSSGESECSNAGISDAIEGAERAPRSRIPRTSTVLIYSCVVQRLEESDRSVAGPVTSVAICPPGDRQATHSQPGESDANGLIARRAVRVPGHAPAGQDPLVATLGWMTDRLAEALPEQPGPPSTPAQLGTSRGRLPACLLALAAPEPPARRRGGGRGQGTGTPHSGPAPERRGSGLSPLPVVSSVPVSCR